MDLIKHQPNIDKIYLHAKSPYKAKYQYLINKREKVELDHLFNNLKAFMKYSNDMLDVYKNIADYNPDKKVLIVIRGRKVNISTVFITQSYFKVPKDVRLNSTHFFIMKTPNKREVQRIGLNHS